MRTIELFCGTKSFSKVAKEEGHTTWTLDNDPQFNPDLCMTIFGLEGFSQFIDVMWASPPCTAFSVASIGKNWEKLPCGDILPISENAELGLSLLHRTIQLIKQEKPKIWFIENPRGMMRKVIDAIFEKYGIKDYKRETVTYCQYGDTRMKPTDIWTNFLDWKPKPACKNGMPCHVSAPRGSRTGTQGIKGAKDRSIIPPALFREIFKQLRENEERSKDDA